MGVVIVDTEACLALLSWTGVETQFVAGFKAEAATDVVVISRDATGADTQLTMGVHYSVTLATDGAVTVVPIALPAAPKTIVIARNTSALQGTDFANLGSFAPSIHTTLHSRAAMRDAEDHMHRARMLRAPLGDNVNAMPPVSVRANKVLGFDGAGQPIATTGGGGGGGGGGAPIDADYVVLSANATLSNERILADGNSIIWDRSNPAQVTAKRAAVTGDVAIGADANISVIGNNVITYGKMQDISASGRLLGRFTAGTGDPEELTGTQVTSLLDVFTTSLKGAVPASGGGTSNFLRADGTWSAPPSGGGGGLTDGDHGDIIVSDSGVTLTIDTDAVTYAKMQNVSASGRFIGRFTAGAGDPEEVTGTQATSLLDLFTSTVRGVVPASGGGSTNFLRADGAWSAPGTGAAPVGAEYITASADATLTAERVATASDITWDFATAGQAKANIAAGVVTFAKIAASAIATAAQYLANTANLLLTTDKVWAAAATVILADAATVAVDLATGINFDVTLAGNRTLGSPTNTKNGQTGLIVIHQDGTGSRTLAYGANWKFAGGAAPVLTTTASATDLLFYKVLSATVIYATLIKDVR